MPLLFLLDNSYSMYKNTENNKNTKKDLSHLIIKEIIEHITKIDKYEFVSLISFSSQANVTCDFTRDYKKLIDSLSTLQVGDCSNLEDALHKVNDLVIDEWGCLTNIQIILLTDEIDSLNQQFCTKKFYRKLIENKQILQDLYELNNHEFDEVSYYKNLILNEDLLSSNLEFKKKFTNLKYPFLFPNKCDIIILKDEDEKQNSSSNSILYSFDDENFKFKTISSNKIDNIRNSKIFYLNEILKLNSKYNKILSTKNLNQTYIKNEFIRIIKNEILNLAEFELKCGFLTANINLIPNPVYQSNYIYSYIKKEIKKTIDILGFINISEFTTPQTISRHMIISIDSQNDNKMDLDGEKKCSKEDFLTLLHTGLKSESISALVKLSEEWFGAIHSANESKPDGKKRSYLMLSIFIPGNETIESVLSKVAQTIPIKGQVSPVDSSQISRPLPTKSYTKGCIVWYRAYNLVSDVQKILRNAKKMHEKMPIFYKELNRVRRAALTFGFYELFHGLSKMFERELVNFGNNYNQEATFQLTHVINCLNSNEYREFRRDIQPWVSQTPFTRVSKK